MGLRSKTTKFGCCLLGAILFAQAPEFAQQYRQRIGGAVEELQTVVTDFDKDAAKVGLSRGDALVSLAQSDTKLAQFRSQSMDKTIARFEHLKSQQTRFANANVYALPFQIFKEADEKLLHGTWQDFKPGFPLTAAGLIYGFLGGFLGYCIAMALVGLLARKRRAQRDRKLLEMVSAGKSD